MVSSKDESNTFLAKKQWPVHYPNIEDVPDVTRKVLEVNGDEDKRVS
jgi:hypothetical protein